MRFCKPSRVVTLNRFELLALLTSFASQESLASEKSQSTIIANNDTVEEVAFTVAYPQAHDDAPVYNIATLPWQEELWVYVETCQDVEEEEDPPERGMHVMEKEAIDLFKFDAMEPLMDDKLFIATQVPRDTVQLPSSRRDTSLERELVQDVVDVSAVDVEAVVIRAVNGFTICRLAFGSWIFERE